MTVRHPGRLVFVLALVPAVLIAGVVLVRAWLGEPSWQAAAGRVQGTLEREATIACIQEWLASDDPAEDAIENADMWPDCVGAVAPFRVYPAPGAGVALEWWDAGDQIVVEIYRPGQRPQPKPPGNGYLASIGTDAYLSVHFK
jgi:hypothetical protein